MAAETPYQPQDTLAYTATVTLQTTAFGAVIAGVQNTLRKQNVGAMGILTKSGGTIALFSAVGATYAFTQHASANLRQKDDTYNHAIAGFLAGSTAGLAKRSIPFMLTSGVAFSTALAAFNYSKGFRGIQELDETMDEAERKALMRANRRRPVEETVAELGEGRGIYAPGYEERRRQRLLEKYGVDVGEVQGRYTT